MKILVFIEHDIIIRHFIHSDAFAELARRHEVRFVFPERGNKRVSVDVEALDLPAPMRRLPVHQKRLELWKRLFIADALRWRPGAQFKTLRRFRREMIGPKAAFVFRFLSLPGAFQALRRWTLAKIRATPHRALDALLNEEKPDVIIHPSVLEGVYINDLVEASETRGLPFVVIMNSWDNPSTKKAVVGAPDRLLVWGEQTKRHAMRYMDMPSEKLICFGAAQFDVFRQPPRISREEFCAAHDIPPSSTILLYAGSSKDSDEFGHLELIDRTIDEGALGDVALVYRPHPWGGGGRGGERILDHPWRHVRIEATMREYLERVRAGGGGIHMADYRDTHDVLSSIDALVSPLSTIIVEAALHGKPALCFLPIDEQQARHFQITAPLTHFEDMYDAPEFLVAQGRERLAPALRELLQRCSEPGFSDRVRAACDYFVESFDQAYSERLADYVEALVAAPSKVRSGVAAEATAH